MRTKTVFSSHSEVAHIWAQQKQYEGRASNMFFEGPSIFSYGRHFEIARFVKPDVILFNNRRYSVSTGKHQSRALRAVGHKTYFSVPSMSDHTENARYLANAVKSNIAALKRARTGFTYKVGWIDSQIGTAQKYLETFRRDIAPDARKEIRGLEKFRAKELTRAFIDNKIERERELNAIATARDKARHEKERLEREERRKRLAIEQAEDIEKWKNGETVYPHYDWPILLRVKGETIETSHGANIPLIAARRLWRRFLKDTGSVVGLNLGNYSINRVEEFDPMFGNDKSGNLIVGCHIIPFSELYRMADVLGWRNGVPMTADEVVSGEAMPRTAHDALPGDGFGEVQS